MQAVVDKQDGADNIPAARPPSGGVGESSPGRWPGPATPWHDSPQALPPGALRPPTRDPAPRGAVLNTFASPVPPLPPGPVTTGDAGLGPPALAQLAAEVPRLRLRCPYCRSWMSRAFARLTCSTCEHCMVRPPAPGYCMHHAGRDASRLGSALSTEVHRVPPEGLCAPHGV